MHLELAAKDGHTLHHEDLSDSPLAIRGLTVSYGEKPAVFSVDATFVPGAMTAIIGPNGRRQIDTAEGGIGDRPAAVWQGQLLRQHIGQTTPPHCLCTAARQR